MVYELSTLRESVHLCKVQINAGILTECLFTARPFTAEVLASVNVDTNSYVTYYTRR